MKQKGLFICLFAVVVTMMSAGHASALTNLLCDPLGCEVDSALIADTARGLSCTGCVTSTMIQNMPLSLSVGSTNPIISATNTNSTQSATGVYGRAAATSGNTYGVMGENDSIAGIGVYGHAAATTGNNAGVSGQSDSIAGIGVYGRAAATTGNNAGVSGQSDSPSGYGGHFENSNGGKALGARVNSTEVMVVDINGVHAGPGMTPTPIAHGFFDSLNGSRTSGSSNITCAWESANLWYACTISGESFFYQSYTVNVTPTTPNVATFGSAGGQLLVLFFNLSGTQVKPAGGFSVTVFKQ